MAGPISVLCSCELGSPTRAAVTNPSYELKIRGHRAATVVGETGNLFSCNSCTEIKKLLIMNLKSLSTFIKVIPFPGSNPFHVEGLMISLENDFRKRF